MRNVHFGAGNIGRGFIGFVLSENGWDVNFVDVNQPLLDALKKKKPYLVEELSDEKIEHFVPFEDAFHSGTEEQEIIERICSSELITTSIGVSILPFVAPLIAKAITKRVGVNKYLNIIACENAVNATDTLKELIYKELSDDAKEYANHWIGFPNSAVDRIVPNQSHEDLTKVQVEPFFEWVIEQPKLKGKLELNDVHFVEELLPFIERKLFTVNTGHATCAYIAYQKGYETIVEAMKDEEVEDFVSNVLKETSNLLCLKYGFDDGVQNEYRLKTIKRFKNEKIIDETIRVARSPLRKLSYNDRFIKPYRELVERGVDPVYLQKAILLALQYDEQTDEEAITLQELLKEKGVNAIQEITGLSEKALEHIIKAFQK